MGTRLLIAFLFISFLAQAQKPELPIHQLKNLKLFDITDFGAVADDATDDWQAIQNAIDAAQAAGGGEVIVPEGEFITSRIIKFPLNAYASSSTHKGITLKGVISPNMYSNPLTDGGTDGDAPLTGSIIRATFLGDSAVINTNYGSVAWGDFSYTQVRIENLTIRVRSRTSGTDVAPQGDGIDASKMAYVHVENVRIDTESDQVDLVQPASTASGLIMPELSNFVFVSANNVLVNGFYNALVANEHSNLDNIFIDACYNGLVVETNTAFPIPHPIHVNRICIARTKNNIVINDDCQISIAQAAFEDKMTGSEWFVHSYDLIENASNVKGELVFNRIESGNAVPVNTTFDRSGSTNVVARAIGTSPVSSTDNSFPSDAEAFYNMADLQDATTNNLDLTNVNSATFAGGGITLVAASAQSLTASSTLHAGAGLTVAGWMKMNSTAANYQVVFQKGESSSFEYNLYYDKVNGFLVFSAAATSGGTPVATTLSFTPDGLWKFVVARWEGANLTLSVNDGTPSTPTALGAIYPSGGGSFKFGDSPTPGGFSFDGVLSKWGIWDYALSDVTVTYLYNEGFGREYSEGEDIYVINDNTDNRPLISNGTLSSIDAFPYATWTNASGATRLNINSTDNSGFNLLETSVDKWAVASAVGALRFYNYNTASDGLNISTSNIVKMPAYGAGTATFDASGNLSSVSDIRLKNIQGKYTPGLKAIMGLNPITYKWNAKSGLEMNNIYAGFAAQNVKANIPYGTGVNKDGMLTLQDRAIMAALVNAVKEQQAQIDTLKKEIQALKK